MIARSGLETATGSSVQLARVTLSRLGERGAELTASGHVDAGSWDALLALLVGAVAEGRDEFLIDLEELSSLDACAGARLREHVDTMVPRGAQIVVVVPSCGVLTSVEVLARRRGWPLLPSRATGLAELLRAPL